MSVHTRSDDVSMAVLEPSWSTAHAITAVAEDLAGEFSPRRLLERILMRCAELLGCDTGSICSVDEQAGTYRKEADIGIRCQSGQVFPLTEGMTGAVVAQRGPVWFDRYEDVHGGHVDAADRSTLRGVIGVPLQWRGSIIGVCVVFSRQAGRTFSQADAELLGLFAKHAAVALANAHLHDLAEERARDRATAAERDRLLREVYDTLKHGLVGVTGYLSCAQDAVADRTDTISALVTAAHAEATSALNETRSAMLNLLHPTLDERQLEDALAEQVEWARAAGRLDARLVIAGKPVALDPVQAHEILRISHEALANTIQFAAAHMVRLGIAYEASGVSLLVQDDGQGFDLHALAPDSNSGLRRMSDRAHAVGGLVELDSLPGWGTSIRVRFPYARPDVASEGRALRVLIVDPHPLIRAGVSRLLSQAGLNIEVVGEAVDAGRAASLQQVVVADVVITSLRLGDDSESDGVDLTRRLVDAGNTAVLCLSEPGDDQLVAAALRAGAHGCLDKGVDGPALAQAVVATARGEAFLSGLALQCLHRGLRQDPSANLTAREQQVRALVEKGFTDKLIAEHLMISVKTVEKHVSSLLRKSGARNRTELVAQALMHI